LRAEEADGPGDAKRGKLAIEQYACVTCHRIPGIVGEHAPVGPPLARMATRELIAGVIANNPQNMVKWLREPQKLHPRTTMPDLGVTERDARDIAAYLATLK
jgi:cytochrome c1